MKKKKGARRPVGMVGGYLSGEGMADPEEAARCLKALAHPARLMILAALGEGEMSVRELEAAVKRSQPNVSHHLRVMLDRGILENRPQGNRVYYRLADHRVLDILAAVKEVYCKE